MIDRIHTVNDAPMWIMPPLQHRHQAKQVSRTSPLALTAQPHLTTGVFLFFSSKALYCQSLLQTKADQKEIIEGLICTNLGQGHSFTRRLLDICFVAASQTGKDLALQSRQKLPLHHPSFTRSARKNSARISIGSFKATAATKAHKA